MKSLKKDLVKALAISDQIVEKHRETAAVWIDKIIDRDMQTLEEMFFFFKETSYPDIPRQSKDLRAFVWHLAQLGFMVAAQYMTERVKEELENNP